MADLQRNLTYRGLTMQEYLDDAGMTAEQQRAKRKLCLKLCVA